MNKRRGLKGGVERKVFREMKMEINTIIQEVVAYFSSAWVAINPFLKWIGASLAFVMFPTDSYVTYAKILGVMVVLDLVSKYYAISVTNGGFRNALRIGKLSSGAMWLGTRRKIVSYFVIMILVGLAYRFEILQTPVEFMATLAYSVMFFREGQSVLENMIQAGHKDLKWVLFFVKKKEEDIFTKAGIDPKDVEQVKVKKEVEIKTNKEG